MPGNEALLRRVYETWNREGIAAFDTLHDLFDPDVEASEPPDFPGGDTHRGVDAWRASMAAQLEGWDRILFEPVEFSESANRVMATVSVRTRGRASGIETDRTMFQVASFRDGRIVRWQTFFEQGAAEEELRRLPGGPAGEG